MVAVAKMVLPNLGPVAMTIGPWPLPASGLILHPMDLALPPHHPPVPGSIYGRVTVKIPHLRRVVVILRIPPIPIKEVDIHREITGRHKVIALATPEWLDPEDNEDNGGAVKRFQLGLHYSLIYCDRPPRLAVTALLPAHFWASSFRISLKL